MIQKQHRVLTASFKNVLNQTCESDLNLPPGKTMTELTFFYTLRLTEHVNTILFFNEIKCKTFYQKGLFFFCACTCQLAGLVLKYLVPKISFSVLCKIASLHNGFISIPIPSKQT